MSFGGGGGGGSQIEDTPEQRYLAQVSAEKWNFAQEHLAPLEDTYMAEVEAMDSPGRDAFIAGQGMQGGMQALGEGVSQAGQQLAAGGIDPSSGRHGAAMTGLAIGGAEATGDTVSRGLYEQDSQQIQGFQNIAAIGQGQSTTAQAGLSGVARTAARDAQNEAFQTFNRNQANLQLLGTVAGAGTQYALGGPGASGGTATPGYEQGAGLNLYG